MSTQEAVGSPDESQALDQTEALTRQLFGDVMKLDEPILGLRDDDIVAPNIHTMIHDPDTVVATLIEDDKLLGFSLAIPVGKMNPEREDESGNTAYIYFTGVEPERQGEGLVGKVMDDMTAKLRDRGYGFMERDCLIEDGYADNVEKACQGAIVEKYDHERWPEIGPERFFRIELAKLKA